MKFKIEISITQEDVEELIRKSIENHPAIPHINQDEIYVSWKGGSLKVDISQDKAAERKA